MIERYSVCEWPTCHKTGSRCWTDLSKSAKRKFQSLGRKQLNEKGNSDDYCVVYHGAVGGGGTCHTPNAARRGTRFPATGQTTSHTAGDDGAIKAGAALSYTDNGDGKITDNNTKLMWEKKDQAGGLHDVGNKYPWAGLCTPSAAECSTDADWGGGTCNAGEPMTIFQWLAQLNGAGFAGHTDWRVPNVKELQSIVD